MWSLLAESNNTLSQTANKKQSDARILPATDLMEPLNCTETFQNLIGTATEPSGPELDLAEQAGTSPRCSTGRFGNMI